MPNDTLAAHVAALAELLERACEDLAAAHDVNDPTGYDMWRAREKKFRAIATAIRATETERDTAHDADLICREHGQFCGGDDCCCADKHTPAPHADDAIADGLYEFTGDVGDVKRFHLTTYGDGRLKGFYEDAEGEYVCVEDLYRAQREAERLQRRSEMLARQLAHATVDTTLSPHGQGKEKKNRQRRRLREQLATALRERDEARAERETTRLWGVSYVNQYALAVDGERKVRKERDALRASVGPLVARAKAYMCTPGMPGAIAIVFDLSTLDVGGDDATPSDVRCACGVLLVRDGVTVQSHWIGDRCDSCVRQSMEAP